MICERCGSIQIARVRSGLAGKVLSFLTGAWPFMCHRCGWRARRAWNDEKLTKRRESALGPAEGFDAAMTALDEPLPRRQVRSRTGDEFDLSELDRAIASSPTHQNDLPMAHRRGVSGKRKRHDRHKRQLTIIRLIALTAGLTLLVTMFGVSGSCVRDGAAFTYRHPPLNN